jgi:hypothetical protein
MTEEKEIQENNNEETSTMTDKVIMYASIIGAFAVGRFFGFLGVGAIAVGWFVYDRTKEKLGRFIAVCAGAVSGLAVYGLAAIAILS